MPSEVPQHQFSLEVFRWVYDACVLSMTAQLLATELTTLFQDSKKKNQDLRNAAEKSLSELKALPQTSEAQLVAAYEVQLKVLQALPSLLQNYGAALSGQLLAAAFEVCFLLYNSKTAVVSNTAAAVLQQLVTTTFEKASSEDVNAVDDEPVMKVPILNGDISIRGAAVDAYRLLNDVCLMTEGQRPKFLSMGSLAQNLGLELLESILANYADTVAAHPEMIHVLRLRLMPLVFKLISDKMPFSLTVRAMRILQAILGRLVFALATECETALALLNRMLDPATLLWKRVLCLEVFQGIYANPTLVRSLYNHFDEKDDKKHVIRDNLGMVVRLVAEKPNLIGLGQQSSSASRPNDDYGEQAALQAGGIVGSIGATSSVPETEGVGISMRWSNPRIPCIDLPDKAEAPNIPATYIYALALTCVNSFSDGLAKFLLPFTSPSEGKSKRKRRTGQGNASFQESSEVGGEGEQPSTRRRSFRSRKESVNPLSLESNALYEQIRTSAHMVENCWPALLAACSTFLNAALDTEWYHALIRSLQKFTQVAGLLEFPTPRDAFLTTLGKHAIPARRATATNLRTSTDPNSRDDATDESDRESSPGPGLRSPQRQESIDWGSPAMTTRNLLCLRALLNLGIALGPSLQQSWSIILETLQQGDLLLPQSNPALARQQSSNQSRQVQVPQDKDESENGEDFGVEVAAAETAAARMIESTKDYSDSAFLEFAQCVYKLLQLSSASMVGSAAESTEEFLSPQTPSRKHQRYPSISQSPSDASVLQSNMFALAKLQDLIQFNISRLNPVQNENLCWRYVTEQQLCIIGAQTENSKLRVKTAETFTSLLVAVASSNEHEPTERDISRAKALGALSNAASTLYKDVSVSSKDSQNCNSDIHRLLLEALRAILERCGDSLMVGWDSVFDALKSTFSVSLNTIDNNEKELSNFQARSLNLVRSSFGSLQLICSDYLDFVPLSCIPLLIDTLYLFCSQTLDLNISFTMTSFFANVSSFLQRQHGILKFDENFEAYQSAAELAEMVQTGPPKSQKSALWLLLVTRLSEVVDDHRSEVRHTALHTLFRVFDDRGDELNASAWQHCLTMIFFQILRNNERQYSSIRELNFERKDNTQEEEWNKTAALVVQEIVQIFTNYFATIRSSPHFSNLWQELLSCLEHLLNRKDLAVSTSAFKGLTHIFEELDSIQAIGNYSVDEAWRIWKDFNPVFHLSDSSLKDGNQSALMAYLRCFAQIYRLIDHDTRNSYAGNAMPRLYSCLENAHLPAYSSDVDRVTPVQQGVLENLKLVPTDKFDVLSQLVDCVADIVKLPFRRTKHGQESTCVAISKSAIDLLQLNIQNNVEIASCQLVTGALDALVIPIQSKYGRQAQGKEPSLWRAATTAATQILQACMPAVQRFVHSEEEVQVFWDLVIRFINGILSADCESYDKQELVPDDEEFDIEAFLHIKKLVVPSIGSSHIADDIRRKFAEDIFEKSQIHEPHPDDLARPGQELLEGLKCDHIGRTEDLPPTLRSKMSYLLLDELFSLVSAHDGSVERVRLAQAAAPYLLLRCGLTLKAYVYDQPLRGRIPQPWSQKKELLYILKKMSELDLEPRALEDTAKAAPSHKKHLFKLYPLLTGALKAAYWSEEATKAISDVLDVVGQDFRI
ncbi:MAG: hypothetical protein Q9191_005276 [Dirinaria sp. TL-2023a]